MSGTRLTGRALNGRRLTGNETWLARAVATVCCGARSLAQRERPMPATTRLAGPRPMGPVSARSLKRCVRAAVLAADQMDDWIRRHAIEHPLRRHSTDFSPDHPQSAERQAPPPPAPPVSVFHPVRRPGMNPPPRGKPVVIRDRSVWLSAIGHSLKAQYDAVATPMPRRLGVLVEQLEAQDQA
jgi:hypothetical protein